MKLNQITKNRRIFLILVLCLIELSQKMMENLTERLMIQAHGHEQNENRTVFVIEGECSDDNTTHFAKVSNQCVLIPRQTSIDVKLCKNMVR